MKTHKNFVSCICILPADMQYPKGLILTGSNDHTIHAFDIGSPTPVFKLEGHTDNVSVLEAGKFGTFVSGSWDFSAKVWMKEKCIMTLTGHKAAVWCVGILDSVGYIVTGSADKTIKVWKGGLQEGTITGHTDCVRSIQVLPDNTFLSASNDASIRHWNLQGECLKNFNAHQSYIYTLSFLPSQYGEVVSGGEDRSVRVWRDSECVQTIPLPAQSVWSVCVLSNGDIAAATSDGMIRIFTRSLDRIASPEELSAYEDMVAQANIPAEIGDIKTDDLPGPDALLVPGKAEGQVMMVKRKMGIEAYQWSSHGSEWVKVGDVTGGVSEKNNAKKKIYQGKEYDYVFDVDIREGEPALKLPYNAHDDPYVAAHHFLELNDLSQNFLDQVANFIMTQVKPAGEIGSLSDACLDPYTGDTRYRGDNGESVTKPDAYAGMTYEYFPEKNPMKFELVNATKLLEKLREFNGVVGEDGRMVGEEVSLIETAVKGGAQASNIFKAFFKILHWSPEYLLPALDSFRFCLLSASFSDILFSKAYSGQFDMVSYSVGLLSGKDKDSKNLLVLLRCLTNALVHKSGRDVILPSHQRLLERLHAVLPGDKNSQVALSSFMLNLCIAFKNHDKSTPLNFIANILPQISDEEAYFRLVVALGTLIFNDKLATAIAISVDLAGKLRHHKCCTTSHSSKIKTASRNILELIK